MMRLFKAGFAAARHRARSLWHSAIDALSAPFTTYITLRLVEGCFPRKLKSHTLYVLTEDGNAWQASMICPCGCGKTLELNLLPDERPVWEYSADRKRRATLNPSVWRKVGCKSHFWLRSGRIVWV